MLIILYCFLKLIIIASDGQQLRTNPSSAMASDSENQRGGGGLVRGMSQSDYMLRQRYIENSG